MKVASATRPARIKIRIDIIKPPAMIIGYALNKSKPTVRNTRMVFM
jgi:hypothetical protein